LETEQNVMVLHHKMDKTTGEGVSKQLWVHVDRIKIQIIGVK
jgi:hypothetical protein